MKIKYLIYFILLPLILIAQETKKLDDRFGRHYHLKKSVFETMPNEKGEIIFLGNSITAGVEWAELFNNPKIKNRGISGDITAGILFRLSEITESQPAKIFIMIGVNDLARGFSIDSITFNYELIIKRILNESPESKIFVQSILPVNDQYDYFKDHTNKGNSILICNEKLQRLAQKYGLTYIDLYSSFTNEKGKLRKEFTFDGLHLNGNAYTAWKNIIEKFVNQK